MKKFLSYLLLLTVCATAFAGCKKNDEMVITVGASSTPHAEILKAIQPLVEEKGYTLEIKEFSDFILPNTALNDGELDANYFQHLPYLESFNESNGTDLVNVAGIHFEPLGIYSNKINALDKLASGDKVAVPNDTTNEARALLLLESQGLITLKKDIGINATINDITENPLNLEFVELKAAQIPRAIDDVAIAVINGNYALQAGFNVKEDALATEDADSIAAQTYENILVVRKGDESTEKTKILIEALQSDTAREFIETNYGGSVIPTF